MQPPTEWTVLYLLDGVHKSRKIAYDTPEQLVRGLQEMTRGGWSAVEVTERTRADYIDPHLGW